jgi:tetratricopeptide (TPR) repeat protein
MDELGEVSDWARMKELANEGLAMAQELLSAADVQRHPYAATLCADLHYIEGFCLNKLQKFDAAISAFEKALKSDKNYVPAMLGLAEAMHAREDWLGAIGFYTQFLDKCVDYYMNAGSASKSISFSFPSIFSLSLSLSLSLSVLSPSLSRL